MTSYSLVTPGQSVTATAYLNPNNSGANLTLWLQLNWYDVNDTIISSSGFKQNEQEGGGYRKVSITGIGPCQCRALSRSDWRQDRVRTVAMRAMPT